MSGPQGGAGRQAVRTISAKVGELLVELELTRLGWHVERLDGSSKAANGDLVAVRGKCRAVIQVKTNGTQPNRAFLGYAGGWLRGGLPFFNGKGAAIETDIVVSVAANRPDPQFFVFTVGEAEMLAREQAEAWFETFKKNGEERSPNFPVSPLVDSLAAYSAAWAKLERFRVGG